MKELLKELERIEKESQAKLNDCISSYLKESDFNKYKHAESLRIFNNRCNDMHAINEIVKTALNRIKLSLEYKKSEKDESYNNYMSSYSLKTNGDYYFAGLFEGELNAYKEIIKMLFGGDDNNESNNKFEI